MRLPPERDDPDWARVREHDIQELWDPSLKPHVASSYRARVCLLERLVERHSPPGARVLDVGCAQGTLGLRLAERGYRVSLLDLRPGHIEYAKARWERGDVQYYVGYLGYTHPPDGNFDIVVCTELLEHVPTPATLLHSCSEKLRPGGLLIVTTPNASYFLSRLPSYGTADQGTIDDAENDSADGDAHRYLLTREELLSLVRGVGLRVQGHGYFLPFWLQGHLRTRYLHRLLFDTRGTIVTTPRPVTRQPSRIARRVCASQWMTATRL